MGKTKFKVIGSLAIALSIIAFTGCSSITGNNTKDGRTAGQDMNDSRITSQVKADLANEQVYKFNSVDVKTFNGVVQLSGFVDSEQQKVRAGQIAQGVQGVARVDNAISLIPQAPTPTGRTNYIVPPQSTLNTNSTPFTR
jgi:osmotically-inducible protein OsmY